MLRPQGRKVVGSRWIYKVKHATDESVEKYKARFMAKGFSQKEGIDYEETFAHVAMYSSIRTIISLVAEMGWRVHQMDIKTAFLNGAIEEEVYIEQIKGFDVENRDMHVCILHQAPYWLNRHLNHGTRGLTAIYRRWDFSRVRLTTTYTS